MDSSCAISGRVSEALNRLNLGTIDASKLGNPGGHLGLLAGFINEELRAEHPADAVVFLGPRERYDEKMPPEMLDKPGEGAPAFFLPCSIVRSDVRLLFRRGRRDRRRGNGAHRERSAFRGGRLSGQHQPRGRSDEGRYHSGAHAG
jgi:hypothetical protein